MKARARLLVGLVPLCLLVAHCSGNPEVTRGSSFGGDAGSGGSSGSGGGSSGSGGGIMLPDAASPDSGGGDAGCEGDACVGPACGDGAIDPGEACDDGNGDSGDGCSANCDAIENDFACPQPGQACVSTVVCGDSKVTGTETCDDGNNAPGDGCSGTCTVESGYKCTFAGVACEAAACGDGLLAGKEKCDDGNTDPSDGCSPSCTLEPGFKCPQPGSPCSQTTCGDGITEGTEQCDDMNNDLGDGCTPFCIKEPICSGVGPCTSSCGDGLKLPNDNEDCEDGNTQDGDGCSSSCKVEPGYQCADVSSSPSELVLPIVLRDFQAAHPDMEHVIGSEQGIVENLLGTDGKPVYAKASGGTATTTGKAAFDQWYRDVAGVNMTVLQTITLSKLPTGEFQFSDSTFFPLDGLGFGNQGNNHNFHFTSEVRYWFEYKGGEQLDFTGDDDVFAFVNKQRVIDLGGVHGAQSASVVLNAAQASALGLTQGSVYEIVVFQAERHTTQSNYKLTLSNFVNVTSSCGPVCGDGVKTPDEQCDDGVNDGGYNQCDSGCKLGPHCGDKQVQSAEGEECDDGINLTPYGGCGPGCKLGGFCGDGEVDSLFGEQCDDGVNDGGYDECAPGCALGPRCGDGVVQKSDGEQCDDGNKKNGDGCNALCVKEGPA